MRGDSRWRLMSLGLRSAALAPDLTWPGRASWAGWFLLLTTLPTSMLGPIINAARSTDTRARIRTVVDQALAAIDG